MQGVGLGLGDRSLGDKEFSGNALAVGATPPNMVPRGTFLTPEYTIGDDSIVNSIVPRDRKSTVAITGIIRWGINEAYALANGEVAFQIDWEGIPCDESEAIGAATHGGTITSADIAIPATANTITYTTLFTGVAAAQIEDIDTIGLQISRVALAGLGVNPTAEPYILSFYLFYSKLFPAV